jgi:acyl-coenzyme A thioesterase PaaI-like protein
VHGSVYFKALDDSAFFAANSLCTDTFVLTSQFNIYLLAAISTGELLAEGRVLEAKGSFWLCESTLKDASGLVLARGQGTFIKGKTELKKTKGYGTLC